ncbi:DUF3726 domain-containing protein [Palleronia sediminis]|nr:DUF3726 domain-containing protein [Palleronia sediminis]
MTTVPHDQTRGDSTAFFRDLQPAPLSRNEVASLCTKAARGAGMSWGMAEEAGFAAAWLVSHGVDGPGYLSAHLEQADGMAWSELCPTPTPGKWRNADGRTLCPIILGATICDHADLPQGAAAGRRIEFGPVGMPILLVPFLAYLAQARGLAIALSWPGGMARIGAGGTELSAAAALLGCKTLDLTLDAEPAAPGRPSAAPIPNAHTAAETIAILNAFAMRTTVPASEASRAGAGSALGDND